ncbi:unnamed protein product, partial [Ilex paraguariensis]
GKCNQARRPWRLRLASPRLAFPMASPRPAPGLLLDPLIQSPPSLWNYHWSPPVHCVQAPAL